MACAIYSAKSSKTKSLAECIYYDTPKPHHDVRRRLTLTLYATDRVVEDDVRVVDFPQHLLNASLGTSSSVHQLCYHELEQANAIGRNSVTWHATELTVARTYVQH